MCLLRTKYKSTFLLGLYRRKSRINTECHQWRYSILELQTFQTKCSPLQKSWHRPLRQDLEQQLSWLLCTAHTGGLTLELWSTMAMASATWAPWLNFSGTVMAESPFLDWQGSTGPQKIPEGTRNECTHKIKKCLQCESAIDSNFFFLSHIFHLSNANYAVSFCFPKANDKKNV